ncbi:MAG: hypothetical protein QXO47_10085 [Thermoproteota archaeon]
MVELVYPCEVCGREFNTLAGYRIHYTQMHKDIRRPDQDRAKAAANLENDVGALSAQETVLQSNPSIQDSPGSSSTQRNPSLSSFQNQPSVPAKTLPARGLTEVDVKRISKQVVEEVLKDLYGENGSSAPVGSNGDGMLAVGNDDIRISDTYSKPIYLSPRSLLYYDYIQDAFQRGGKPQYKSLLEFVDDIINEHFSECLGVEVSFIKRKAYSRGGV